MNTKKTLQTLEKSLSARADERNTAEIWSFSLKKQYRGMDIILPNSWKVIGVIIEDGNMYFNCPIWRKMRFLFTLRTNKAEIRKRIAECQKLEHKEEIKERIEKIEKLKEEIKELTNNDLKKVE